MIHYSWGFENMKPIKFLVISLLLLFTACSSVKLEPADFAWPIESVLTTDADGNVSIDRYSTEFNAANLFKAELGDSAMVANKELRIIRDKFGYYVMTSPGFMNVYVFQMSDGSFVQTNKIFITKEGLTSPALNQRSPNIELVNEGQVYIIDSKGLKRK